MFLDILEFTVENKKNYLYKKVQILRKIKTKNQESVQNLWQILGTKLVLPVNF